MNRAFSKILILIILIILVGGGIFAWQYFVAPKEAIKMPEGTTTELSKEEMTNEQEKASAILINLFEKESQTLPNLEEELEKIQISPEEESFFFEIIQTEFDKAGVKITQQELKECCTPLLERALKVLKLRDEAKKEARDLTRKADITQIATAMEMFYGDNNKYPQSKVMPVSIGIYLSSVPTDPLSKTPYYWLDNTSNAPTGCNSQTYCIWAMLEGGGFYVASEKGTKELSTKPTRCPCLEIPEVERKTEGGNELPDELKQEISKEVYIEPSCFFYPDRSIKLPIKTEATMLARFTITNSGTIPITLESAKFTDKGYHHGSSLRYSLNAITSEGKIIPLKTSTVDSLDFGYLSVPFTINGSTSIYLTIVLNNDSGLESGDSFKISIESIGDITYSTDTRHGIPVFMFYTPAACDTIISQ